MDKIGVRAFIAFNISYEIKEIIESLQKSLKSINLSQGGDVLSDKIRWVSPENIHITLKFLGNIEGEKVEKIKNSLGEIAAENEAFIIRFKGVGVFPNVKNPRIIWVGIDKGLEELRSIYQKVEEGLKKINTYLDPTNRQVEDKEFKPHLTLGRIKSRLKGNIIQDLIDKYKDKEWGEMSAEEIILYKSTLTPKGPIYSPLGCYPLCKEKKGGKL